MRIAIAAVWSSVLVSVPLGVSADFVVIASEPGTAISEVDPSISEDGTVAFIGGANQQILYVGAPGAPSSLSAIDLSPYDLAGATSVHTQAGYVVFIAQRGVPVPPAEPVRGVYAVPLAGGPPSTLIEGCSGNNNCEPDEVRGPREFYSRSLAISPNGTVAFSTVYSGAGAIYRGPVDGSVSVLQWGTFGGGFLFNTINLDVNDVGKVAVQTEYQIGGPFIRGIFVLQTPNETAPAVETVVHGLTVGEQPEPSFADNSSVLFPQPYTGEPGAIFRGMGVPYGDHPLGGPVDPQVLVDTNGPYASFGRLNPIDEGSVLGAPAGNYAFEAFLDDTRHGVFTGPDPIANRVLIAGDAVLGGIASEIYMGAINSAGQIVMRVEVERAPLDVVTQIIRFDPVVCPPPEPPKPPKPHKPKPRPHKPKPKPHKVQLHQAAWQHLGAIWSRIMQSLGAKP
jgi:hypothetical protein